jgi:hypothetical protein
MHCGNRGQRSRIYPIQDAVYALQKIAYAAGGLGPPHGFGPLVKLSQIGAGAETALQFAVDDQSMRVFLQIVERRHELFQFIERQ